MISSDGIISYFYLNAFDSREALSVGLERLGAVVNPHNVQNWSLLCVDWSNNDVSVNRNRLLIQNYRDNQIHIFT